MQTEDRVSKKVLAEAPIVCGACGAEFQIRAADIDGDDGTGEPADGADQGE